MRVHSLPELYQQIPGSIRRVCVVPVMGHAYRDTDYLYQLYRPLSEQNTGIEVQELSAFQHYRLPALSLFHGSETALHYHWLEFQDLRSQLGMPYKIFFLWLYLLFGGRLIWTVHNLRPHDGRLPVLHRKLHLWFASKAILIHVHSTYAAEQVQREYQVAFQKIRILRHPDFPADIRDKLPAVEEVNERFDTTLDPNKPLLLVFGAISEYKGIRGILEVTTGLKQDHQLFIAGYVKKNQNELHHHILKIAAEDPRITYRPGFIPASGFPSLLSAADICIFNHTAILTSGGIEMARSYNKTILAPAHGAFEEYTGETMHFFHSTHELKEVLCSLLSDHD